jgi:hypothetical protein
MRKKQPAKWKLRLHSENGAFRGKLTQLQTCYGICPAETDAGLPMMSGASLKMLGTDLYAADADCRGA